jgi:hypothetical protein
MQFLIILIFKKNNGNRRFTPMVRQAHQPICLSHAKSHAVAELAEALRPSAVPLLYLNSEEFPEF